MDEFVFCVVLSTTGLVGLAGAAEVKGLDMGYKLKGKYTADKLEIEPMNFVIKVESGSYQEKVLKEKGILK